MSKEKIKDFMEEVDEELLEDKMKKIKPVIKEKKKEIELAKRTLEKLEKEYQELLEKKVDELYYEEESKALEPLLQYNG